MANRESSWGAAAVLLIVTGLLVAGVGAILFLQSWPPSPAEVATAPTGAAPTAAPAPRERLVPTRTPAATAQARVTASPSTPPTVGATRSPVPAPSASPQPSLTPAPPGIVPPTRPVAAQTPPATATTPVLPPRGMHTRRERFGFAAPQGDENLYDVQALGAGWYLTGQAEPVAVVPDIEFVPVVRVQGAAYSPGPERLGAIARTRPGALWVVGNEPDVIWQGNATPDEYAQVYHDVFAALKAADPTCRVAIGGVAQVTPLRLRYLDAVLAAYKKRYGAPMPVDVWNVHLAILREERGSWGVDIPPGLPDDAGRLFEIADNADVEILKRQVTAFREWMAGHGWRDRPLIVTEFSVLMPPEYGFPPGKVEAFMGAAFEFLLSATDGRIGCPADGGRLVQRFAWYSLADRVYATGNLFDPATRHITPLGLAFAARTRGQ